MTDKPMKKLSGFKISTEEQFKKSMQDQLLYDTEPVIIHTTNGDIKITYSPYKQSLKNSKKLGS